MELKLQTSRERPNLVFGRVEQLPEILDAVWSESHSYNSYQHSLFIKLDEHRTVVVEPQKVGCMAMADPNFQQAQLIEK